MQNDGAATTESSPGSPHQGFLRALSSSFEYYTLAAHVVGDRFLRSLPAPEVGGAVVSEYDAGGVRLPAAWDLAVADAMWIGDVFPWFYVDALGSWIGCILVFCGDCFQHFDDWESYSVS